MALALSRAVSRRESAIIMRGMTTLMQCASAAPESCVLRSATLTPMRVKPIQMARYSGRLGIKRQTTSPRCKTARDTPACYAIGSGGQLRIGQASKRRADGSRSPR